MLSGNVEVSFNTSYSCFRLIDRARHFKQRIFGVLTSSCQTVTMVTKTSTYTVRGVDRNLERGFQAVKQLQCTETCHFAVSRKLSYCFSGFEEYASPIPSECLSSVNSWPQKSCPNFIKEIISGNPWTPSCLHPC